MTRISDVPTSDGLSGAGADSAPAAQPGPGPGPGNDAPSPGGGGLDLTYGLGIDSEADEVPPEHANVLPMHQTSDYYRALADMGAEPLGPARLIGYQGHVVGASNDSVDVLSYLTGVLGIVASELDLGALLEPGGRGLRVAHRVTIMPILELAALPDDLRSAIEYQVVASDLWLVSRHRPASEPALSVIDGAILRELARAAMLLCVPPCTR